MKRESPNGGALGAISERELMALQSVLGNLNAVQGDKDLLKVLNQVRSFYGRLQGSLGGDAMGSLGAEYNDGKTGNEQGGSGSWSDL